ncbi:universal stress protein [Pseudonocardia ailaonensis]|uniref:Universal stress protein n=1 Tax=Pseudonocardia ailaonensis TaxID=367279 RepID=A0ABN2NSL3_9PSEU
MTQTRTGAVVVGVDGSDSALDATRWAATEAVRRGAPLRLVAAVAWTTFRPIGVPALGQEHHRSVLERQAVEHLDAAAAAARATEADVTIEQEVSGGEAPLVLSQESERAALVVLGSRGRGGFASLLLGSVAVEAVARAACPVVVVRGTPDPGAPESPVVVGLGEDTLDDTLDGGVDATALAFAFEEAARHRVPLTAVHAVSQAKIDPFLVPLIDWEGERTRAEQDLDGRLAGWQDKYPGVSVRTVAVVDGAASELVERSRTAGLLVVGSRGHGVLGGPLLGSVSQAVLHHAACPVAVVRPEGRQ